MHWIAPSEKDAATDTLEKRLWAAADQFRANSGLTAQQYSGPILGLIFLRFAEARFSLRRAAPEKAHLDRRALRALSTYDFLRGWHALLFLFPNLHPDNARDHGDAIEEVRTEQLGLPGFEQQLNRRHTRSGWPVALECLGNPANN